MSIMKEKFIVDGMHCTSCEQLIENELNKLNGVINVTAIYKEACVYVEYDSAICNFNHMKKTLNNAGYTLKTYKKKHSKNKKYFRNCFNCCCNYYFRKLFRQL